MSDEKFDEKNLAQNLIILIAGLQDIGLYKEAESLSKKYSIFKEAQSSFVNVIDEESRRILDFAHPNGNLQITQSEYGQIHTDTSRQLKILENLNHAPTGKQVVAMVGEALGLKKKAQQDKSKTVSTSVFAEKFSEVNELINSFNSLQPNYTSTIDHILNNIKIKFDPPENILLDNNLLNFYIKESNIDKKEIDLFNRKRQIIQFPINLDKTESKLKIREFVLKYISSGNTDQYSQFYKIISAIAPSAAKNRFFGTNHDGKVDKGWIKTYEVNIINDAQWSQKINEYARKYPSVYIQNQNSVFNAIITCENTSTMQKFIESTSWGVASAYKNVSEWLSSPQEMAKKRQEAYALIELHIELSFNNENFESAIDEIYGEISEQMTKILANSEQVSNNVIENLQFMPLSPVTPITSVENINKALNELTLNQSNNNHNNSIASGKYFNIFNNELSAFASWYNLVGRGLDGILKLIFNLEPKLKEIIETKNSATMKLAPILGYWFNIYSALENEKSKKQIEKYYNYVSTINNIISDNSSLEEAGKASKNLPKAFQFSSEEDFNKVVSILNEDIEIHKNLENKTDKAEIRDAKANIKFNNLTKIGRGSGEVPGGGDGSGGGGVNPPSPLTSKTQTISKDKVEQLQQILVNKHGVNPKLKNGDSFVDGFFGKATMTALRNALKDVNAKYPSTNAELDKYIEQLGGSSGNNPEDPEWYSAPLVKFGNGVVTIKDLKSLQSFEAMLVKNDSSYKAQKDTNGGLTYETWRGSLLAIRMLIINSQEIRDSHKKAVLVYIDNLFKKFVEILSETHYANWSQVENQTLLSKKLISPNNERSVNQNGGTSGSGRTGNGTSPIKKDEQGNVVFPFENQEQEQKQDIKTLLYSALPFDSKQIYLANIDKFLNSNWTAGGRNNISLALLSGDPGITANTLFSEHNNAVPAYAQFLSLLTKALSKASYAYLRYAGTLKLPPETMERLTDLMDNNLAIYLREINKSLRKLASQINQI